MDVNTTLAASAIVQEILWAAGVFFLVYLIGYSTFQFLAVATGASELYRRRREARYRNRTELDCHVPVSILVPAHNEGVTIVSSVRSLLSLDYSLYEIVVVDDGSTDDTSQRVIDAFDLHAIDRPIRRQVPCRRRRPSISGRPGACPSRSCARTTAARPTRSTWASTRRTSRTSSASTPTPCCSTTRFTEIVTPVIEHDNVVAVGGLVRLSNGV